MSCVSPRQRGRFSPCRCLGSRHQLYRRLSQLTCHLASIMVTGAWPTTARLCSVVHVCSHTILSPLSVTASQSERHVVPPAPHAPWGCSGIPMEFQSQTVCQLKHGHTGTHTVPCSVSPGQLTPSPRSKGASHDARCGSDFATHPPGQSMGVRDHAKVVAQGLTCGDLPSHRGCPPFSPKPLLGFLCLQHVYFL